MARLISLKALIVHFSYILFLIVLFFHPRTAHSLSPAAEKALKQKAHDRIFVAVSNLELTQKQKNLFKEEVEPYAIHYLDEGGQLKEQKLQSYLMFQGTSLQPVIEDEKEVVAVCSVTTFPSDCTICSELASHFEKSLTRRFARRGVAYRSIESEKNKTELTIDKFDELYGSQGCAQLMLVKLRVISSEVSFEVKGKFHDEYKNLHEFSRNYTERLPAAEKDRNQVMVDAVVKLSYDLFSVLGKETSQILASATSGAGSGKKIRLTKIKNYDQYIAFKKKAVNGLPGVKDLREVFMSPGVVEFEIVGESDLNKLSKILVNVIGAEPVVTQIAVLPGDNTLQVELQ